MYSKYEVDKSLRVYTYENIQTKKLFDIDTKVYGEREESLVFKIKNT